MIAPVSLVLRCLFVLALTGGQALAAASPDVLAELGKDQPGAKDFAAAGRYEGARILAQTVKAFDELTLPAGPAVISPENPRPHIEQTVRARGRVTRTLYVAPEGRSTLEILSNHEDALKQAGFAVVFECAAAKCGEKFAQLRYDGDNPELRVVPDKVDNRRRYLITAMLEYVKDVRYSLLKKPSPEGDSYVGIYAAQMTGGSNGDYSAALTGREGILMEVVEPKAMQQRIVTVSATDIGNALASQGHQAFYGLYFDFDKAVVKPESEPQLAEMAKYLTEHPQARVFVVGHTDNAGQLDYNVTLSQKRAEAVVDSLVTRYRIARNRLVARGLGPLAPVAANADDAGRAKNRRVELVESSG